MTPVSLTQVYQRTNVRTGSILMGVTGFSALRRLISAR
jgi:hypothetical protein